MSLKKYILFISIAMILVGIFLLVISTQTISFNKGWPLIFILIGILFYIYIVIFIKSQDEKEKNSISNDDRVVLESVKNEFMHWIKREGLIVTIMIVLLGFFGIRSYLDSFFIDVKLQSKEVEKKMVKLNEGLKIVDKFTIKIDLIFSLPRE